MSPETALSKVWLECFSKSHCNNLIGLIAVDEAHCICDWYHYTYSTIAYMTLIMCCKGNNFRPQFKELRKLRSFLQCPVMAMTATAPSKTLREISQSLCMTRKVLVLYPLDRPNIFVNAKKIPQSQVVALYCQLQGHAHCNYHPDLYLQKAILSLLFWLTSFESFSKTIVYVQRKVKAGKLWQCLSSRGLKVGLYHSSLRADTRLQVEMKFKTGKIWW